MKPVHGLFLLGIGNQPPSGGCVLKRAIPRECRRRRLPAAFRRLCVETYLTSSPVDTGGPAAFRRLCVETDEPMPKDDEDGGQPPSGGCVLKLRNRHTRNRPQSQPPSGGCVLKHKTPLGVRMRYFPAAFRRLCVETPATPCRRQTKGASRLQAAVC